MSDTGTPDDGQDEDNDEDDVEDESDDTGATSAEPPPGGIGAADAVGETGGCGCTTQPVRMPVAVLVLMFGSVWLRRRHRSPVTD